MAARERRRPRRSWWRCPPSTSLPVPDTTARKCRSSRRPRCLSTQQPRFARISPRRARYGPSAVPLGPGRAAIHVLHITQAVESFNCTLLLPVALLFFLSSSLVSRCRLRGCCPLHRTSIESTHAYARRFGAAAPPTLTDCQSAAQQHHVFPLFPLRICAPFAAIDTRPPG
ncbi:hypothetical protein BDY21DRAFT_54479 [Lineolata rhizophorae]|uniref:Uncharacterized protein n=1 Tax=Lineolata rhizophorae TaxID=578093 RepID=A0A6A6NYI3_9PEZI|nr:hypothetical protein BDY21DRAFT_54479 [Lineolata rhizophorae]